MAFLVGGANSASGAYEIENSLRFNGGGNAEDVYLTRDYSSAGNQVTWTFSCWIKRTTLGEERPIFAAQAQADLSSGDPLFGLFFHTTDQLRIWTNAGNASIYTNRVFRDVGAWYHIHLKASSSSPYYNLYINGVEETSFNTDNRSSYPGGNDTYVNSGNPHFIGGWRNGSIMSPGMYLADVAIVDGTAHAPTDFAKTNDNGVWVPKKPNVSAWGTNGCFLEFKQTGTSANASGIGADTSGQDNHMSVVSLAATDVTTDTPTNNFCTLNPAGGTNSSGKWTFSEGNRKIQQNDNGSWRATGSTMAVSKGKWYWEIEFDAGTLDEIFVGFHDTSVSLEGTNRWLAGSLLFYNHIGGEVRLDGTDSAADYGELEHGDILGVALNMDDNQVTFYDNGSAIVTNLSIGSNINEAMPTFLSDYNDVVYKVNFGNPPFSISSGNADANGYGNFEYTVPTNYYALCTKNFAEFG